MPLGPTELIIILVIVLVIFGAGRLSQVGGALGRSIREFRDASEGKAETTTTTTVVTPAPEDKQL
ncbi:MAG TPA: twin-arginine translocase TatA/TatE family subunit [Chloroflexia bacterium]|nr:twin-arginine translocase TatA/TatE family subunit [Chloroflexia bacterium]